MGRHITEEHRQKIRDAQKKRWAKFRENKTFEVIDISKPIESGKQGRAAGDTPKGIAFRLRNKRNWTEKAVEKEMNDLFLLLVENEKVFSIEDLISDKGYTHNDYKEWIDKYNNEIIQRINDKIRDIIESRIKIAVKNKDISAQFGQFLLKAQYDYVEKNISEVKVITEEVIPEAKQEIMKNLLENIQKENSNE